MKREERRENREGERGRERERDSENKRETQWGLNPVFVGVLVWGANLTMP